MVLPWAEGFAIGSIAVSVSRPGDYDGRSRERSSAMQNIAYIFINIISPIFVQVLAGYLLQKVFRLDISSYNFV